MTGRSAPEWTAAAQRARSRELMTDVRVWSLAGWRAEAARLFGTDKDRWAWVCPICTTPATLADFVAAGPSRPGVRLAVAGRECIGRLVGAGCRYAAYGLIAAPWTVIVGANVVLEPGARVQVFPFASPQDLERHRPVAS